MCPFLTFLSQICRGLEPILYKILRKPLWNVFLNISVASSISLSLYPIFWNKRNLLNFAAILLFREKTTFDKQIQKQFYKPHLPNLSILYFNLSAASPQPWVYIVYSKYAYYQCMVDSVNFLLKCQVVDITYLFTFTFTYLFTLFTFIQRLKC